MAAREGGATGRSTKVVEPLDSRPSTRNPLPAPTKSTHSTPEPPSQLNTTSYSEFARIWKELEFEQVHQTALTTTNQISRTEENVLMPILYGTALGYLNPTSPFNVKVAVLYALWHFYFSQPEASHQHEIMLTPALYRIIYSGYDESVKRKIWEPVYLFNKLADEEHAFALVPVMAWNTAPHDPKPTDAAEFLRSGLEDIRTGLVSRTMAGFTDPAVPATLSEKLTEYNALKADLDLTKLINAASALGTSTSQAMPRQLPQTDDTVLVKVKREVDRYVNARESALRPPPRPTTAVRPPQPSEAAPIGAFDVGFDVPGADRSQQVARDGIGGAEEESCELAGLDAEEGGEWSGEESASVVSAVSEDFLFGEESDGE
ncbi:hypothetical protein BDK51DRAFT_40288 [Blyttiomyces helicus]|uniref:Small nuclear RNA activating complex, subunit SNAP43-domain-containing protein n=1 Tax=Blyttiomyces helicus TaxID=388810 RepID=A0A4P9WAL7_9FUNG|nr:hypothetical protein BDK51DRAFT_40288 [Blyttiomyces helicus]|eukprot:RKO89262.1 hypothetical protein BDK51DRAFT_40288 [Blyttiomyces helicus]